LGEGSDPLIAAAQYPYVRGDTDRGGAPQK